MRHQSTIEPTVAQYIAAAKRLYETPNGSIMIVADEDGADDSIEVTEDGLGAYVDARVWVEHTEIDLDRNSAISSWQNAVNHEGYLGAFEEWWKAHRRRPAPKASPIRSIDIILKRRVGDPLTDEENEADTLPVHDLAETFPESIKLVRVLDCDGVFLYYAGGREEDKEE